MSKGIAPNATYDNTLNNPYNPNDPPQTVTWGETTYDEMFIVGLNWVPYQEGDEDIIIGEDSTTGIEEVLSNSGMYLYSISQSYKRSRYLKLLFGQKSKY